MSTGIAKAPEKKAPQLCQEMILASRDRFAAALGKQMPVEKLAATVALIVARNPKLPECGIASIVLAAFTGATLGLSSDPVRGEFYIVPFKDKLGRMIATPMIGYKGKIKLGFRGGVQRVSASEVCEGDEFAEVRGLAPNLTHTVKHPRGNIIGAYAIVWLKDNPFPVFSYMTVEEIETIRQRAPSRNSPAWTDSYPEQCKKTAIHRVFKYIQLDLPEPVLSAMELDDSPDAASEMRQVFGTEVPAVVAELETESGAGDTGDAPPASAPPPPAVRTKAASKAPPPPPVAAEPAPAPGPLGGEVLPPLANGLDPQTVLAFIKQDGGSPMTATSLDQALPRYLATVTADPAAWQAKLEAYLAK